MTAFRPRALRTSLRLTRRTAGGALLVLAAVAATSVPAFAQRDTAAVRAGDDGITVRFVEADLRAVVQSIGRHLVKPIVTANVPAVRVSLETPAPVDRPTLTALLRGVLEANGLLLVEDSLFFRVVPKPPEAPPRVVEAQAPAASLSGAIQLFVMRLKHARAGDVAATVNLLFGSGGGFSGRPGLGNGTLSDELQRNAVPPQTAATPPPAAGRGPASGGASLNGSVTIVPDELTNSLLVRASQPDFAVISNAVDQLDIRPLQVLIEVLIVEARRDNTFSLGADLFVPPQNIGDDATAGGRLTGGGLGDLVINLMNLGKGNVDAVLRTAQLRGNVEIVSRPVLLASNNTEARFLVGTQRPFVQVSRSLPTDSPSRDQVVQYKDVGTKLTVRPTINQDGYVSLLIQQEINAATNETQFDAPVISTREASTQVLVRDGQTIVLGGLRDHQKDRTQSGVPILSGIPIIGGLFGSSTRRSTATELFLFLTPRIIRSDADADSLTAPRLPKGIVP